jgi:NAD+ synthase
MEDLAQRLVSWIKERAEQANCGGVVFGLSGGIDSAVVGVICRRAFPKNSLGVMMPCHSSKEDLEDALAVAQQFAVPTVTVTLDEVFDCLLKALPDLKCDDKTKKLAEANLKPRLRMSTLYYLANRLNYLVVGTSNKSEIAVGYFTKYGDGGVDIMPLANLLKRDVNELARHLGIPKKLIEKAPSAGLWPGQTDEGEMGVTYKELDQYLASGQATDKVRQKMDAMARASAHKRTLPATPPF